MSGVAADMRRRGILSIEQEQEQEQQQRLLKQGE
jgi:hypothetical protein